MQCLRYGFAHQPRQNVLDSFLESTQSPTQTDLKWEFTVTCYVSDDIWEIYLVTKLGHYIKYQTKHKHTYAHSLTCTQNSRWLLLGWVTIIEEPVNLVGINSGRQWHALSAHQLVD